MTRIGVGMRSALAALCVAGTLGTADLAVAQAADTSVDAPAMRSMMNTPDMLKATAAVRRGDFTGAAVFLRSAVRQGNPLAKVTLGRMYFEGRGVPRNYDAGVTLLESVIDRHQEPFFTLATDTLKELTEALARSPDRNTKLAAVFLRLRPTLKNPLVQRMLRNYNDNLAHAPMCGPVWCWYR